MVIQKIGHLLLAFSFYFGVQIKTIRFRWTVQMNLTLSPYPSTFCISVSEHFLAAYDVECTPEVKKEVVQCMGSFQDGVAEKCVEYFQRYLIRLPVIASVKVDD